MTTDHLHATQPDASETLLRVRRELEVVVAQIDTYEPSEFWNGMRNGLTLAMMSLSKEQMAILAKADTEATEWQKRQGLQSDSSGHGCSGDSCSREVRAVEPLGQDDDGTGRDDFGTDAATEGA